MSNYVLDLIPLWTAFLAFTVFYYVLFDGFDLGVGMLYGLAPEAAWQPLIMNSVAPIWDGNETWLVLGGLGLLAAFPLAYAIIIPAVYFPILAMLLGLVFRGVAFEFRFKHAAARRFWDRGFCVGSAVATFAQGVILGTFVQGFDVKGRVFAGTSFDWLTPFAILCGIALMLGYTLLGAGWLIMKTEGGLQAWARSAGRAALVGTALAILAVSIWTPLRVQALAERWFSWPNIGFLSPVPVLAILVVIGEWRSLNRGPEFLPFFGGIALFLLSYIGIAISLWPMIVPFHYTIWQAASSTSTQVFLMIGTMF
ncbi:MAG: cytochrome d ubiquinol oxidase subunit II, partial [Acetobacteraceae bacterium]